jgi:hypothetical protein
MNTQTQPIGKVFTFIQQDKQEKSFAVQNSIDKIIDIIKYRTSIGINIEAISNSLLDDIFQLRLDILEWSSKQETNFLDEMNQTIVDEIIKNTQLQNYNELNKAYADSLEIYYKVMRSIQLSQTGNSSERISEEISTLLNAHITFTTLKNILSIVPQNTGKLFSKFLEESLKLEVSFIIADFIIYEDIKKPKKLYIKELASFILKSVERYGAYAITLKLWTPENVYENHLINKTSILATTIALDNNLGKMIAIDNLQKMLSL